MFSVFPDPKDIHDGLEQAGLDATCWLMSALDDVATYRIILHGEPMTSGTAVIELVRSAFCEPVHAIQCNRLAGGWVLAVTVCAPQPEGQPA